MKNIILATVLVVCCLARHAEAQPLRWDFLCKLKEGRRNYPGLQYCVPIGPCKVLVVGGYVGGTATSYGNPTKTCEIVNPCCERSEPTGSMITSRAEHVVLLTPDSNVIAIGGIVAITNDNSINGPLTSSIELYNRSTGTWSSIGNLVYPRRQAQARFINSSEILVTGGRDASLATYDVSEIFNVNTRTSRVVAPTPFAVNMHVMGNTSAGATIVAAGRNGGTNAPRTNTIWSYNRVLDTFILAGTMTLPNRSCQILRMFDGRLLISGGVLTENTYSGTDRIIVENGGSFSPVGRMRKPRWGHAMSQFSDDSVLIYGGNTEPAAILIDSCEWFIPSLNLIRSAPSLSQGLSGNAWASVPTSALYAPRLPANAVLAIGGVRGNGEMARGVPVDSVFILRACTVPDSIRTRAVSDSCRSRVLSLDSVNTCRTPSQILWSFGDGSGTASGSWSIRHSFPEFKQYTVTATLVYPACGDSVRLQRILTVDNSASVTASPKRLAICEDESGAVLTASGATRYEWRPSSTLSSPVGATVVARPRQTTTYVVRGYTRDSCSSEDSVVVEVRKRPDVRIAGAPLVSMCKGGDSVNLSLTVYTGVRSVRWTPAGGVACDTCRTTKARPDVTTTYVATVTDTNGCVSSDSLRILVRSGTAARILGGPVVSVCTGGDSLLLALTTNVGVKSVRWSPNTGIACDTCKQTKVLPTVSTTYTAMITDAEGCKGTDSIRINVGSGSKIMRASGEQFICFKNDSARISVLGRVRSVEWTPAALVSCSTCVTTTVKPSVTTTYTFLAVDSLGCTLLDSVRVTVLPKSSVDIDSDTALCGSTPLRVSVFGTYQRVDWSPAAGVNCPTCPSVLLTPVPGTTITYRVTGHNGNSSDCDAVDSVRFRFAPGIEGQLSDRQMCPGDSVVVSLRRFGGLLQCSPPVKALCDTCTTYVMRPTKTTRYVLTGDSLGCVS
ncbi:MAG: kelch repeat-containing protein, partial [Candidatus Kapaibacterium sp.]